MKILKVGYAYAKQFGILYWVIGYLCALAMTGTFVYARVYANQSILVSLLLTLVAYTIFAIPGSIIGFRRMKNLKAEPILKALTEDDSRKRWREEQEGGGHTL